MVVHAISVWINVLNARILVHAQIAIKCIHISFKIIAMLIHLYNHIAILKQKFATNVILAAIHAKKT